MYKNYFLFKRQVKEIRERLINSKLIEVFSYQKNEIIFRFQRDKCFFLQIGLDTKAPHLILQPEYIIKKPKVNLLQQLENNIIHDISIPDQERIVNLHFSEFTVQIVYYGRKPYLLLLDSKNEALESFRRQKDQAPPIVRNLKNNQMYKQEEFINIFRNETEMNLLEIFKKYCPVFNKNMINEVLFRSGICGAETISNLNETHLNSLYSSFTGLLEELENGEVEIITKNDFPFSLSLIHFSHQESTTDIRFKKFNDINEAWLYFIHRREDLERFSTIYLECKLKLNNRHEYLKRAFKKMTEHEDLADRKKLAELKGNLIFTFLKQINAGASKVTLENIFSDDKEKIEIKLNPAKSATENANNYFNKFKNMATLKTSLHIKKETLNHDKKEVEALLEKLDAAKSLKKISALRMILLEKNIIHINSKDKSEKALSFPRIIIEKKWEIYLGKSGLKNDQLTFKFARPWDIWFHAQGVPGSHVVLRLPDRNTEPSYSIIEKAAAIAAFNSKYKNELHAPVIYTFVRHVSRIRKAPPGTVKVQQEKVIFVDPISII